MDENTENAVKPATKVRGKPFVKGDDPRRNLDGKPLGTKNFETDFDEAVDEIAKENNMTRSEARKVLLKVAFKQAKDGNYSFYKDIHDRIYGQAKAVIDADLNVKVSRLEDLQNGLKDLLNGNKQENLQ